jgi:glycerol kinase
MHYLTIDQGGHGSRAGLFDGRGQLIGSVSRPVGESRPGPGRVEQDPLEILASVREAVDELLSARPDTKIASAGLATQRASVICWDRQTGEPLTPVLSWQDRRQEPFNTPHDEAHEEVQRRTGLRISPHYGAGKLRWCLENVHAVASALQTGRLACGPLASFLLFHLVPERPFQVDPANGCRTLLWNLEEGGWDQELLEWAGVPRSVLPQPSPTISRFGVLETAAGPVPLKVLNGDQSCVPFALGKPRKDTVYVNLGTGAFLQCIRPPGPQSPNGLLRSVILHDGEVTVQVEEGTVNGAGSALDVTGCSGVGGPWLESGDPPLYLNGVSGLGSPWWQPEFRSRFIGTGDAVATRDGVVESVLFLIRANLDLMTGYGPVARLVVTGGLSRSTPLCRRLADLCSLTVVRPEVDEATSAGLAFLVAGSPGNWCETPSVDTFTTAGDHPVRRRYRRWLAAMERSLR